MFCQFCGAPLPKRTKYCKHCGAKLTGDKGASGTESLECREDEVYEWMVKLAFWGLGLILGGMVLMKKAQLSTGLIVAYMILSSLVFLILFWLSLSRMFSLATSSQERIGDSQIGQLETNELDQADAQMAIDIMPSLAENTTRRLEPSSKEQGA
jgi:zinc ribbon protein